MKQIEFNVNGVKVSIDQEIIDYHKNIGEDIVDSLTKIINEEIDKDKPSIINMES